VRSANQDPASADFFGNLRLAAPATRFTALLLSMLIAACGSAPKREPAAETRPPESTVPGATAQKPLSCVIPALNRKRGGGYYLDDGPQENTPPNLDEVTDAVPKPEPLRVSTMKPYEALGRTYTPMTAPAPYKERGIASWYGRRYHGQKTASGEVYDMYGMTAAHPTLPIPSYVRVTNLKNGRSVVVRVNDRGPFHAGRVIDLSFTAACKLDILGGGSQLVEVEAIIFAGDQTLVAATPPAMPPATKKAGFVPSQAVAGQTAQAETLASGASSRIEIPPEQRPDVMEALTLAPASDPGGVYLQLGAFDARDNADNFLNHLRVELAWLADRLTLRQQDGLYRVNAGPYPSQSDAHKAAQQIAQTLGFKPIVTSR
jgi:peptidoglycan lytic transglycosylase